jgi:hypothetical protein
MAPQPLPEGPAWRACRDVAAADLAITRRHPQQLDDPIPIHV